MQPEPVGYSVQVRGGLDPELSRWRRLVTGVGLWSTEIA